MEVRGKKLKNCIAEAKDAVSVERIQGWDDLGIDLVWKLYNMVFESDVVR